MSENKDKGNDRLYRIVLISIIGICLVLLILQNTVFNNVLSLKSFSEGFGITGHATESSTVSNVTIEKILSIALCENLSEGIIFGNVTSLPATDLNASHNYDGESTGSSLCVNISEDGNTAIDLCTKADQALTSEDLDVIGLGNETYANSTTTDADNPVLGDDVALSLSYEKSGGNLAAGGINYYRFWLDVPGAQASGDYNNTVYFKGVATSLSCGS